MKYEINLNSINTKLYILPQLHNLQCIPFFSITYPFFCNELKRTIRSKGGNDSFSVLFVSFVAKFCFSWIVWHWVYCILLNQHFCRPTESLIDRTFPFSVINRLSPEHPLGQLNQPTKFVIDIFNVSPTHNLCFQHLPSKLVKLYETSQSCHQHSSSPTSVTNIHVAVWTSLHCDER